MSIENQLNQDKNKLYYEKKYAGQSIANILYWLKDPDKFIEAEINTETSWNGLYRYNFKEQLPGKKVLEMGCGDCTNAALMAAFGAEVFANDIADYSGEIIEKLNDNYKFKHPIVFIEGDFLNNNLPSNSFDFIVGKAFLHHLTIPVEKLFLKETSRLLKPEGEARFFEPAVNNRLLDEIRWIIPVPGRPSKLDLAAFKKWKEKDPHPERSFSSAHFEKAGKYFFEGIEILPIGSLERIHRLLPKDRNNKKFRQWALKAERNLPGVINRSFARSQIIFYRKPLREI